MVLETGRNPGIIPNKSAGIILSINPKNHVSLSGLSIKFWLKYYKLEISGSKWKNLGAVIKLTSSITSMVHSLRLQTPLLAKSSTRPGVPTNRCTG